MSQLTSQPGAQRGNAADSGSPVNAALANTRLVHEGPDVIDLGSLRLTHRESAPDQRDYDGEVQLPDGTRSIVRNRHFDAIDYLFRFMPGRLLDHATTKADGGVITVADFGGGPAGMALQGIRSRWGDKVDAVNVDLLAGVGDTSSAVRHIRADVTRPVFPENTLDLAFSYRVCGNLKNEEQTRELLCNVVKALKPGGVAVIDDDSFLTRETERHRLQARVGDDVKLGITCVGGPLILSARILNLIDPGSLTYKRMPFAVLTKGEADPEVSRILKPGLFDFKLRLDRMRS